jgi:zinc transporter 9
MAGGSKVAVFSAIIANSLVTVAKLAGFAMTGSGSMLSEGIHSLADVGNQSLLAVGMARAARPADESHPAGYEREAFIWSLISAVGMFFLGCGVSITHGVQSLLSDGHHGAGHSEGAGLNIAILVFALVIEGACLGIAVKGLLAEARQQGIGFFHHVKTTDDPFGVAVLLEDAAAVLGVLLALAAIGLASVTGQHWWDPVGSILIGLLLGAVATFLIAKNRALLIGRAVKPADAERLRELLSADPAVERVVTQQALVTGSSSWRISAELDFDGTYLAHTYLEKHDLATLHKSLDNPEALKAFLARYSEELAEIIGDEVDRIEERIRAELPKASSIAIEPD